MLEASRGPTREDVTPVQRKYTYPEPDVLIESMQRHGSLTAVANEVGINHKALREWLRKPGREELRQALRDVKPEPLSAEEKKRRQSASYKRWYAANRERKLEQITAYNSTHREEAIQRTQQWRAENLEYARERDRRYHAKNRAERNEDRRTARAEDPEPFRALQRASYARRAEQVKAAVDARRRRLDAMSGDDRTYVDLILADPCGYCGGSSDTVDHIVAVSAGGENCWENFAPACRSCNASKNARPLLEFLLIRRG